MFKDFVAQYRPQIATTIETFLKEKIDHESNVLHKKILQDLLDFSLTGKMLRGIFVLLAHEMYGGKELDGALRIAAALELNQSGLLIHDDIMDHDRLRRGNKTMFAAYEDIGKQRNALDSNQYGLSSGILIGDIAFFMSYELLSMNAVELQRVMSMYSSEMLGVSYGQLLDFDYGQTNYDPTEQEILYMYLKKTGRYSFVLPFVLGAMIAGAKQEELEVLDNIGGPLGVVFQIKDDEIGLFGSEEKTGKPVGSDIRENKKTLVRSLLYSKADNDSRKELNSIFGNPRLTEDDIQKIKNIAERNNISQETGKCVERYIIKAKKNIDLLSISDVSKSMLNEMIDYIIHRDK